MEDKKYYTIITEDGIQRKKPTAMLFKVSVVMIALQKLKEGGFLDKFDFYFNVSMVKEVINAGSALNLDLPSEKETDFILSHLLCNNKKCDDTDKT